MTETTIDAWERIRLNEAMLMLGIVKVFENDAYWNEKWARLRYAGLSALQGYLYGWDTRDLVKYWTCSRPGPVVLEGLALCEREKAVVEFLPRVQNADIRRLAAAAVAAPHDPAVADCWHYDGEKHKASKTPPICHAPF